MPNRLPGRLALELGPDDATSPLDVRVLDDAGSCLARQEVRGRQALVLPTPRKGRGGPNRFTLRLGAEAGGLRVFRIRWVGIRWLRKIKRHLIARRLPADRLHTLACGDFTLMHRDHWFDLRGYPEWEIFSMNLDGFLCHAAHYGGARETMLGEPMRIYHIEHGHGFAPERSDQMYRRLAAKGIPWLGQKQLLEYIERMRNRGPLVPNGEGWGLAQAALPERTAGGGGPTAGKASSMETVEE